jgi:hypothetical protein
MPRTVLQVINISHLNKWVSLKFKAHQLQKVNTPGENLFIQSEEWDNLSQILDPQKEQVPQFSSNGLMETDLVQRKKISLRTLRETPTEIPSNSTRIPHTSQELVPQMVMIPPQKTTTSENRELLETSLKSMVLQHQRVNMAGDNQCIQLEVKDNLSQILDQLKEPVLQSSSNGLMETDLVQRKKISLRILRETQLEIPASSTKTPLISQVLAQQTVTMRLHKANTMVDQSSWETDI